MNKLALAVLSALLLAACGSSQQEDQSASPADVDAEVQIETAADQPDEIVPPKSADEVFADAVRDAVAGDWRSEQDVARDKYRHPVETLQFFGIKPDTRLVEISPGGGWYTQILAPLVSVEGSYRGAIAADDSSDYARNSNAKLRELLAAQPAQFSAVELVEYDPAAPHLGDSGSADMVLTFRNVHNWLGSEGQAEAMFAAFFDVLAPGGVLGVVEHRADPAGETGNGYVLQSQVVDLAEGAGFTLLESSEINANPADPKDHAKGVWTLPPTFALGDEDRARYEEIGESDRMTLKFVKPLPDEIFQQDNGSTDGN